ncbi:hypothetical protein [Polaromonas sp. CG9_12]|nr:hypothetical protein [Polaromonas sp. CG9_12]
MWCPACAGFQGTSKIEPIPAQWRCIAHIAAAQPFWLG